MVELSTRRAGRARVLLALAALAAGGVVIALWSWRARAPRTPPAAPQDARASAPRAAPPVPDEPLTAPSASADERVSEHADARRDPRRFDGRGTLRGLVRTPRGVAFPERWRVVVEPSELLEGRERAERRAVELAGDVREFLLDDLPLGGYAVRAEAEGMNSPTLHVLLVRQSPAQYVTTELTPAGTIDGSVVDAAGLPAEGVELVLASARGERRTARTDPAGRYEFPRVLDGEYTLWVGSPEAPLLPPLELAFQAPALAVPLRELPPLGELEIEVVDDTLAPVPDVAVRGFGAARGRIEARTDATGRALARHLPPGEYRIEALDALGRKGKLYAQVVAGERASIAMRVTQ
jgi:hypothetical protein